MACFVYQRNRVLEGAVCPAHEADGERRPHPQPMRIPLGVSAIREEWNGSLLA